MAMVVTCDKAFLSHTSQRLWAGVCTNAWAWGARAAASGVAGTVMVSRQRAVWLAGAGMRAAGRRSIRRAAREPRSDFDFLRYTFFAFFPVTPAAT
jgi:hypothetical protein